MYLHDARHSSQSHNIGPRRRPRVLWEHKTLASATLSSPAVLPDGRSYAGSNDGTLYAFGPDGKTDWVFRVDRPKQFDQDWLDVSTPAIAADGTIYFTAAAKLYALTSTGEKKWDFATGLPLRQEGSFENEGRKVYSWLRSAPAIDADGTIYFGSGGGKLYAVGPDGAELWGLSVPAPIQCSPAVGPDGTVYFTAHDHMLYAVAPGGRQQWRVRVSWWGKGFDADPVVANDGTVYVADGRATVFAFRRDGTPLWRREFSGGLYGYVVGALGIARDGTIYVTGPQVLRALTPDGEEKWRFRRQVLASDASIDGDGTVYISVADEGVYALTPNGSVRWKLGLQGDRAALVESQPAIGIDGSLHFGGLALTDR